MEAELTKQFDLNFKPDYLQIWKKGFTLPTHWIPSRFQFEGYGDMIRALEESNVKNKVTSVLKPVCQAAELVVAQPRKMNTKDVRTALKIILCGQGYGKNSQKQYGVGPSPRGGQAQFDWRSFKGPSHSQSQQGINLKAPN